MSRSATERLGLEATYSRHQFQPRPDSPLCVILVGLGIPEVDQDPVTHVLRYEPAKALYGLCGALLIGRNDLARSSGSMRADSAVEPTKSENITVTWRRSARSSGRGLGVLGAVAVSTEGTLRSASLCSAAIASSSLSRCPSAVTPSSFRFSCVKLARTVSSISFSRKVASYFPRP